MLQYKHKFIDKIVGLLKIKNNFKDIKENIGFKKIISKNKEKKDESKIYKQKIEELLKIEQNSKD